MLTYFLYISILILVGSFSYVAQYGNDLSLRISVRFICFLTMFIPAILRYGIGTDYFNYIYIYEGEFRVRQVMEPGFKFIGLLCHSLNISSWGFIAIVSGITYGMICFSVPRRQFFTVSLFYILSFCYLNSYNIIRQLFATSLLLYGLSSYCYGKKLKGFLYFFLASSIHTSSIIMFPIIILSNIKINRYVRFLILLIISFFLVYGDVASTFISWIALVNPRYTFLLNVLEKPEVNTGLSYLIYSSISVLILINSNKIEHQKNGNFILNINSFYILLLFLATRFMAFGRMYGAMFFIPLFSISVLYSSNKKYAKIFHYILLIMFLALFYRYIGYNVAGTATMGIFPYRSIFNK